MRQAILLISFFLVSCSSQSQGNTTDKNKARPDSNSACEICLLENEVQNCEAARSFGIVTKESDKYFDSLSFAKSELELELKNKLSLFQEELNLKSDFIAKDSARNWCISSYEFGQNLNVKRKDSLFIYLYDEMYNGASGYSISMRKGIQKRDPRINEKGQTYIYTRDSNNIRQELIIEDWDAWKKNELESWDKWMVKIDIILLELHDKKHSEFTDIEKVVFRYQLSRHKYLE